MTKTDFRKPKPQHRSRDVTPDSLAELRRWLERAGYVVDADLAAYVLTASLGTLAFLNSVATAQLGDGAVTLAKVANIATSRLLGRVTAGTGAPEELTGAQATGLLDVVTSGAKGLAPASGGGTANFLRADGSWAVPHPIVTAVLGSDHSIASTTATVVSGLTIPLTAGVWEFRYSLIIQSTDTTVGIKFGVNYTGTTTRFVVARRMFTSSIGAPNGIIISQGTTPTGRLVEHDVARTLTTSAPNLGPNAGFGGANLDCLNIVEGVIEVSDSGDLELWHGSETATATSVESGSVVTAIRAG